IKKQQETALISEINKQGKQQEYGQLLPQCETYYTDIEPYALAREYYLETVMRNVALLRSAFQVYQLKQVYENTAARSFEDRRNNLISSLEGQYKNYNNQVDKEVFEALITLFAKNVPAEFLPTSFKNMNVETVTNNIYKNSAFVDYASVKNLLEGDAQTVISKLEKDPGYQMVKEMADTYFEKVTPKYEELQLNISGLERDYMKALLELSPKDARIFPNANSTLRVTYGKVAGYSPADAVYYEPVTHLEGVMQKYVPGDYEFDVPQ